MSTAAQVPSDRLKGWRAARCHFGGIGAERDSGAGRGNLRERMSRPLDQQVKTVVVRAIATKMTLRAGELCGGVAETKIICTKACPLKMCLS